MYAKPELHILKPLQALLQPIGKSFVFFNVGVTVIDNVFAFYSHGNSLIVQVLAA
jgi:hypothetical protein